MIKTIVTNGMEAYVRVTTDNGTPVNGHYSRTSALRHEWDAIVAKRGLPRRHVYVFDGTDEFYDLQDGDIAVGILDTIDQNRGRYDVVVSHHPGAYLFDMDNYDYQLKLLGPEYLLMRPEYNGLKVRHKNYVAYVPGGNHQWFWKTVGHISYQYPGVIVENYAPSEAAKIIANAGLVVCSASTVALEAMALGKRVLTVLTAHDQIPIVTGMDWLGYNDYMFTAELLHDWHKLQPIKLGNRYGARDVATAIYKEANR